ncbi:MAG: sodium:solute symporter family protein [Deferrisomatales bacterium]
MKSSVLWLFVFVGLYWAYCLFWGVKGFFRAKTASDYFIAGRQIPMWVFVLAATATSFSGWTFVGHPALEWRDGLPYAFASFYVITIPLTGTIFLKRQWMLGKRYGYITPGEMYSDYYGGEAMRWLTVLVALFYSIPYLGLQLRASGVLFNILTHDLVPVEFGMWALSLVVLLYVALGGLRSVAYVDTAQCILLMAGIVIIGIVALAKVGGWAQFTTIFGDMIAQDLKLGYSSVYGEAAQVLTPAGQHKLVAIPGWIQWVPASNQAVGGVWTGMMCLTYMWALMGIQASPAFSMWAFSNTNPRPFAPQQVWASSFGVGLCLFVFTCLQGLGGWVLIRQGVFSPDLLRSPNQESLVPALIDLLSESWPLFVGVLAVCALAAMQSTGAAYMSTAGGMVTRDIYLRYLNRRATSSQQKFWGRFWVCGITVAALLVATFSTDALVMLGGLAVSYGTMMWIPLAGVMYVPWLTRQGVVAGLVAGMVAVTLTYPFRYEAIKSIQDLLGIGSYPLTIHCAGWGALFNVTVAVIVSALTQPNKKEWSRRMEFHRFLRSHAGVPPHKAHLKAWGWALVVGWQLCAIGPFAVLGNDFFWSANDPGSWPFGMPPLWVWQIVWWLAGVYMMWFLAYKLGLSTHFEEVESLREDIALTYGEAGPERR